MQDKNEYRRRNEEFLTLKAQDEGIKQLCDGVFYEVLATGKGRGGVTARSVVVCHYRGELMNGKVFDDSWSRECPEAFRVSDLIEGFQAALCDMRIGDRRRIYIYWQKGYGKRSIGNIPGYSSLIFEVELINIA